MSGLKVQLYQQPGVYSMPSLIRVEMLTKQSEIYSFFINNVIESLKILIISNIRHTGRVVRVNQCLAFLS